LISEVRWSVLYVDVGTSRNNSFRLVYSTSFLFAMKVWNNHKGGEVIRLTVKSYICFTFLTEYNFWYYVSWKP